MGIVGCGGHRTGGWGHPPLRRVTIDFVGAAVPSGPSITGAPPWSPSSVMAAPCHLLPCGAKALAVPSGALKCRWRSPHPSRLTPCHLPPGEGFRRAVLAFPLPGGRWPAGPDEGGYRWVQWPSNGRMGTSAPTPGYDRFRRGRCPQRPGIPPPLCGPPPFHKGGCCYASSGSLVKGSWHGRSP